MLVYRNGKHRLTGVLDPSPVLSCRFLERVDDRLRFFYQHGGMLSTVVAYSAVLPCRDTTGVIRYAWVRILIDKIQPRFCADTARAGALRGSIAACQIYSAAL